MAGSSASAAAALTSGSSQEEARASRRDFLSYALSLMRSHNSEHSDSLPVLDVASMKHVAYVFDALVYYMRSGNDLDLKNAPPVSEQQHQVNFEIKEMCIIYFGSPIFRIFKVRFHCGAI